MSDKEWLLNANAIKKAKVCISLIEQELGVRLKLTHPQFLNMIKDYAELCDSSALQKAYLELANIAEAADSIPVLRKKVVNMPHFSEYKSSSAPKARAISRSAELEADESDEIIEYKGRAYPKYNDKGMEFKGLYRGQARYA